MHFELIISKFLLANCLNFGDKIDVSDRYELMLVTDLTFGKKRKDVTKV